MKKLALTLVAIGGTLVCLALGLGFGFPIGLGFFGVFLFAGGIFAFGISDR